MKENKPCQECPKPSTTWVTGIPNHEIARFLRALDILDGCFSTGGAGLKEHPGDRRCRPYPSIYRTPQWRTLARRHSLCARDIDQCMLGAPSRKRTTLGMGRLPFDFTQCKCNPKVLTKAIGELSRPVPASGYPTLAYHASFFVLYVHQLCMVPSPLSARIACFSIHYSK